MPKHRLPRIRRNEKASKFHAVISVQEDLLVVEMQMPTRGEPLSRFRDLAKGLELAYQIPKIRVEDVRSREWKKRLKLPRVFLPGLKKTSHSE